MSLIACCCDERDNQHLLNLLVHGLHEMLTHAMLCRAPPILASLHEESPWISGSCKELRTVLSSLSRFITG